MLNDESGESARKFLSLAMQRVAACGQRPIAERLGVSEATISRFVASDLERACQILAVIGLQVSPNDSMVVSQEELAGLRAMTFEYLRAQREKDRLRGQ